MRRAFFKLARSLAVVVFLSTSWTQAYAIELPMVQNVSLSGNQLTWDAVEGATGYNVQLGSRYLSTVRGNRVYTVTDLGTYTVVAFDDNGNFSPAVFSAENRPFFEDGVDNRPVVNRVTDDVGYFSIRCFDVAAGDSCVARCPDFVGGTNGGFFVDSATGGACNSSGTDFVNAHISPEEYSCTVTSFTARVEAQVACNLTPNN